MKGEGPNEASCGTEDRGVEVQRLQHRIRPKKSRCKRRQLSDGG